MYPISAGDWLTDWLVDAVDIYKYVLVWIMWILHTLPVGVWIAESFPIALLHVAVTGPGSWLWHGLGLSRQPHEFLLIVLHIVYCMNNKMFNLMIIKFVSSWYFLGPTKIQYQLLDNMNNKRPRGLDALLDLAFARWNYHSFIDNVAVVT